MPASHFWRSYSAPASKLPNRTIRDVAFLYRGEAERDEATAADPRMSPAARGRASARAKLNREREAECMRLADAEALFA